MDETQNQEATAGEVKSGGLLHINIVFDVTTGKIDISGNIDSTDLCIKVLVEAAHVILVRNIERDRVKFQTQAKVLEVLSEKKNGAGN